MIVRRTQPADILRALRVRLPTKPAESTCPSKASARWLSGPVLWSVCSVRIFHVASSGRCQWTPSRMILPRSFAQGRAHHSAAECAAGRGPSPAGQVRCTTSGMRCVTAALALVCLLSFDASATQAEGASHMSSSGGQSQLSPADSAALRSALASFDAGQPQLAEPALLSLAQKYPGNFEANETLGLLYAEKKQYTQAVPYLARAVHGRPGNPIAHSNLGAAYLQTGNITSAIRELTTSAKLDPRNGETQSNLGQALVAGKRPADAARAFGAASALDPADCDLIYNWATALYDAGQNAQAAEVLARIPATKRTDSVESLAGDIAEKQGHYQEAAEHLQNAARLNPTESNIYAVAVELMRHWSWQHAIQTAQYGIQQFPDSTRLQLAAGIAHYGNAQYTDAADIFAALLAREPDNEADGDLLGRSCAAMGDSSTPSCSSLITFAEKHQANAAVAVYAASSILHRPASQQDLGRAQRLLEQSVQADPRLPDAYYQLGVLQQQLTHWDASVSALRQAIALRPAYAEAHYRLARAYSHLHQPEQAQAEIALQQQYSQQAKDELNARLKEVTTFLTASH
jgi:tetratricopeptide (TPR) repeat protein